jgi:hypothetical protein
MFFQMISVLTAMLFAAQVASSPLPNLTTKSKIVNDVECCRSDNPWANENLSFDALKEQLEELSYTFDEICAGDNCVVGGEPDDFVIDTSFLLDPKTTLENIKEEEDEEHEEADNDVIDVNEASQLVVIAKIEKFEKNSMSHLPDDLC